jgi:hypothetical protein
VPESLHDKTMREHGERYAAQKATEKNFAGYTGYTTKGSFWKEQKKDLQDKLRCVFSSALAHSEPELRGREKNTSAIPSPVGNRIN